MTKRETDSFHAIFFLTAIFLMLVVLFFVFTFSARSIVFSKELLKQKTEVRSVKCLEEAGHSLTDIINERAHTVAENQYNSLAGELGTAGAKSISEDEALYRYRESYRDVLERELSVEKLSAALSAVYSPDKGNIAIDADNKPSLQTVYDEQTGEMSKIRFSNLNLVYTYGNNYSKSRTYEYEIDIPSGIFFDGNDDLFDYSMIAQKGIYITGSTSSIVGNIFAGTHTVEEYRKAESGYGEREIYGGINVLSTQLGIDADKVISTGEINLKGAFAVLGTEEDPITIYSGGINELSGIFLNTSYNLNGNLKPRSGREYENAVKLINSSKGMIDGFSLYYDSNNDEAYTGKYRKILSGTDVNIAGDFTGVIITSGNVIIEADSNVEGFILASDRIYIQGNNNIVSNRDIMREIITEEYERTDRDPAFAISSYLGGLKNKGMEKCQEYMVKINP